LEARLNRDSGLKGICGANDMREVQQRAESGDPEAQLAVDMYCYRIRKYIGAYCAVLGRVDALVFTAGIGENSALVREKACAGLEGFGIAVDPHRNRGGGDGPFPIQTEAGAVKVLVVPTDEEVEIAEQTRECLRSAHQDGQ
jgi:acetate kinase